MGILIHLEYTVPKHQDRNGRPAEERRDSARRGVTTAIEEIKKQGWNYTYSTEPRIHGTTGFSVDLVMPSGELDVPDLVRRIESHTPRSIEIKSSKIRVSVTEDQKNGDGHSSFKNKEWYEEACKNCPRLDDIKLESMIEADKIREERDRIQGRLTTLIESLAKNGLSGTPDEISKTVAQKSVSPVNYQFEIKYDDDKQREAVEKANSQAAFAQRQIEILEKEVATLTKRLGEYESLGSLSTLQESIESFKRNASKNPTQRSIYIQFQQRIAALEEENRKKDARYDSAQANNARLLAEIKNGVNKNPQKEKSSSDPSSIVSQAASIVYEEKTNQELEDLRIIAETAAKTLVSKDAELSELSKRLTSLQREKQIVQSELEKRVDVSALDITDLSVLTSKVAYGSSFSQALNDYSNAFTNGTLTLDERRVIEQNKDEFVLTKDITDRLAKIGAKGKSLDDIVAILSQRIKEFKPFDEKDVESAELYCDYVSAKARLADPSKIPSLIRNDQCNKAKRTVEEYEQKVKEWNQGRESDIELTQNIGSLSRVYDETSQKLQGILKGVNIPVVYFVREGPDQTQIEFIVPNDSKDSPHPFVLDLITDLGSALRSAKTKLRINGQSDTSSVELKECRGSYVAEISLPNSANRSSQKFVSEVRSSLEDYSLMKLGAKWIFYQNGEVNENG